MYEGALYCLSSYMTQRHFEEILSSLRYTNRTPTQQHDQFGEIHQLVEVWNAHVMENFILSWINTIDESISKWINEYTCPGYIMYPGSCGSLVMSTTTWVVHSAMSFGRPISVRGKIDLPILVKKNTMNLGQQWEHFFV